MTGLVPIIHVAEPPDTPRLAASGATWMAGTSPAMTEMEFSTATKALSWRVWGSVPAIRAAPFPAHPKIFTGFATWMTGASPVMTALRPFS